MASSTSTTTTITNEPKKSDECVELKNIKYKSMLYSGNIINETKVLNDIGNLEKFLEKSNTNGQNEPWSKLDKTLKTKKILLYAKEYSKKHELCEKEEETLILFLKDGLDKKKMQRVKDVIYDKVTGEITDIPALFFNKSTCHFTLKNTDKRVSTSKSLPAKKVATTKTIKNKIEGEQPSLNL